MFISYYSSVLLTHLIIQSPRVIIQMISLELSFDICGFCLKICILCSILLVDFVWHIVHPELCVCYTMFIMFCINGCCLCIRINHWYLTLEGLVGELIGRGVGRCLCIYQFTNNFSLSIYQISNVGFHISEKRFLDWQIIIYSDVSPIPRRDSQMKVLLSFLGMGGDI